MRFCPQCSLILEAAEWNSGPIYVCRSCGGCWLARAEFTRVRDQGGSPFAILNALFPSAAAPGMFEGLPKPCPNCRTAMLERPDTGVAGASPRTCPQCQGVWIEAGEPGLRDSVQGSSAATEEMAPVEAPPTRAAPAGGTTEPAVIAIDPTPASHTAEPEEPAPTPQAVGPEHLTDILREPPTSVPAIAVPVPWLPPVADSMPDPRPLSRRSAPLTAETLDDDPEPAPPTNLPRRWCPQCRRAYFNHETECAECRIGLAEGSFKVQCLRCRNENTIAADRCWSCHARMHPDLNALTTAGPPLLPSMADIRRLQRQSSNRPPGSGSCGAVLLWVFGGCAAAGLITLLLER